MPKALSVDLRQRALSLYAEGFGTVEIAARLKVSPAWTRRQRQRQREGKPIEPAVSSGRRRILDPATCALISRWVDEQSDATLDQLRDRCRVERSIRVSVGTMWNTLRALKLTLKKSRSSPASRIVPTSRPRAKRS